MVNGQRLSANGRKGGRRCSAPPARKAITINPVLIPSGAHILVAVSGGADSVALLHVLISQARRKRWRLTVAHLEHGIRGKASREDAAFVKAMALSLHVPCVIGRAKVPALAQRAGISLEMAARQARYAFLVRTARQVGADVIATAHTANDQVETLLMKFLRGAGRAGLSGIEPSSEVSGIRVVRPLLEIARPEIETFLRAQKRDWREDETNADSAFLRNRVRHELIPLLERDFNPGLRQTLQRMRDVLAAEDEWMDDLAREILAKCRDVGGSRSGEVLRSDVLSPYPLAARRRVIRLWLYGQGVPEEGLAFEAVSRVDHLLGRITGSGAVELSGGWKVNRHYGWLSVAAPVNVGPVSMRVRLNIPGKTVIPGWGITLTAKLCAGVTREKGAGPGKLPAKASLNAELWAQRELWIRGWKAGDRMVPYGMKGSRKIQDILVDAKVPRIERSRIPVVECEGEIVWIPGYRIAAQWAVEKPENPSLQLNVAGPLRH